MIMLATTSSCWASGVALVGGAVASIGDKVAESEKRSPIDPAASATNSVSWLEVSASSSNCVASEP